MAAPHYGGPSGPCYGGPSLWHPLVMVAPRALAMVAPRYGGPSLWRPLAMAAPQALAMVGCYRYYYSPCTLGHCGLASVFRNISHHSKGKGTI